MKNLGDELRNAESEIAKKLQGMVREQDGECEYCGRPIFVQKYADGEVKVEECFCHETRRQNQRMKDIKADTFYKSSLINRKEKLHTFDGFIPEVQSEFEAKESAIKFVENFSEHLAEGDGILFQGSFGTGKTHLAASIGNELYKQKFKVLFIKFPWYLDKLRQTFKESKQRDDIYYKALDADLLIIDEVWASQNYNSDFEVKELYKLTDERMDKPTIYTTNYSSDDFLKNDLGRVFSRMLDSSELVILNGKDKRRRKIRR